MSRNRIWMVALVPVLLVLAGCAEERRANQEQTETLSTAPFFHGGNAVLLTVLIGLFTLATVTTVAAAVTRIRVAKHEAYAQVGVAREKTRQAELGVSPEKS